MIGCSIFEDANNNSILNSTFSRSKIAPQSLSESRYGHTATLLNDGRVIIVGGFNEDVWPVKTSEIFNPKTGVWTKTAPMSASRAFHGAIALKDGRVLVTGGLGHNMTPTASAEVWDPKTDTWKQYLFPCVCFWIPYFC